MDRKKYLAAEIFGYSYQNYADHLGIGNDRFEEIMPGDAAKLERAEGEDWGGERIARELGLDPEAAERVSGRYAAAAAIVDAPTPAAGLREGLRQSFDAVLGDRRIPDHEIETYIVQACYRMSDLICRMQDRGGDWRAVSDDLREEP